MSRQRAFGVLTVASAAMSGLIACASILGIEDTGFAELEGGAAHPDRDVDVTSASQDGDPRRDDGAAPPVTTCTLPDGTTCANGCFENKCSPCPTGTTNLALGAKVHAYSSDESPFFSDQHLKDGLLEARWQEQLRLETPLITLELAGSASVRSVTTYAQRTGAAGRVAGDVQGIKVRLVRSGGLESYDSAPAEIAESPDGDFICMPGGLVGKVVRVEVTLGTTVGDQTARATLAEIEICGFEEK